MDKINLKSQIAIYVYKHTSNAKLRRWLEKRIAEWTGGFAYSQVIRYLYREEHGIDIGYGTYGGCWVNAAVWWQNIKIGRWCSFAGKIDIFTRNHHMEWFSTHPCLDTPPYGAILTNCYLDDSQSNGIEIGNDVWMGQNAVITAGCKKVGNGAIIGSGSVVTHDVPPYAIVAGNPARVLRYRFNEETIKILEATQWWNLSLEELRQIAPMLQEIVNKNEQK